MSFDLPKRLNFFVLSISHVSLPMLLSRTNEPSKKKRKSAKANRLTFERFEPRYLMSADGIVASYGSDFGSQGWSYSYNRGGQDLQSNGGNLTALNNVNGNRVANGDPSSGFLFLNQIGGHPGAPQSTSTGSTVDQYAVVTWEVPESGYYEIVDSRIEVPHDSGDGVEFRVYVNNDAPVTTGIADPSRISYFDSRLGFLSKGDSVRVAFGANGTVWRMRLRRSTLSQGKPQIGGCYGTLLIAGYRSALPLHRTNWPAVALTSLKTSDRCSEPQEAPLGLPMATFNRLAILTVS